MLDTIDSGSFAPWVGKKITVETNDGALSLEVFEVKENPRSAGPNSQRIPFSIIFRGGESPCLTGGLYNLQAGEVRMEGVNINRILPHANSDGTGAFYQAVFN